MIRVRGVEQMGHTRVERDNGVKNLIEIGAPIRIFGEHAGHQRPNALAIVRGDGRHLLLHNLHDEIVKIGALERVLEREKFIAKAAEAPNIRFERIRLRVAQLWRQRVRCADDCARHVGSVTQRARDAKVAQFDRAVLHQVDV